MSYHTINTNVGINHVFDSSPTLVYISFVNFVPNRLKNLSSVVRFEGPDILVLATNISKISRDEDACPPSTFERTIRKFAVACSLG